MTNTATLLAEHTSQRSRGVGRLSVCQTDGPTRIKSLYQQGCAKLRLPSNHNGGDLEAVMINTAGGMTGGDRLEWVFEAGAGTKLVATTQACEKIYRSESDAAKTSICLTLGPNAKLAWLPQETILFDRSAFHREIEAKLAPGAEALFIESMIFGRAAMGEAVQHGVVRDRWRIWQDGHLIHAEEFALRGPVHYQMARRSVASGCPVVATVLLVSPRAEALIDDVRRLIADVGAASAWNGKLLARITTESGHMLRQTLQPLIGLLNPCATVPRIWSL